MSQSTVQAIFRKRTTHSLTFFGGVPSKALTKALMAAGFTYDGRSKQWYQTGETDEQMTEEQVAKVFIG